MMQMLMMGGDSTLESLFSEEDYQLLDKELQTHAGMGVAMVNKMKPLMVMTLLLKKYVGDQPASYEGVFIRMAQEKQKEILGLETIEDQMAVFDAIPYEDQADDISEMLRDEGRYTDMFAQMVELYKAEDVDGLYDMFTDFYEGEEAHLGSDAPRPQQTLDPQNRRDGQRASCFLRSRCRTPGRGKRG